nr:PfkB family carbohydrate kinase [Candidatus Njordarchaeota archaeon]
MDVITIGAINWDINMWVDEFPRTGEEVPVGKITRVPGGKAANVAVAAARVAGKKRVSLFGALGEDDIGRKQVEILAEEDVDTSYIKFVRGVESGQAYITIDKNGSNFIETLFGANHEFLPDDLLEQSRLAVIEKCRVIAISDPIVPTAEKIAALGAKHGAVILYDPGTKLQAGLEQLKGVLKHTSVLIVNSVESNRLAGSIDPLDARAKLKEYDLDVGVVVKLGEKGSAYAGKKDEKVMMPSFPLKEFGLQVVSTVGCGDAFLGVLAASLSEGFSDTESIERANLAGGLKATKAETRGCPTKNELERTLEMWRRKR